ncbi:hypothetical protein KC325_g38 [Hortaea werneckii]|nr:hypothetical protein KC325_g38 [Hortaea werneckii]
MASSFVTSHVRGWDLPHMTGPERVVMLLNTLPRWLGCGRIDATACTKLEEVEIYGKHCKSSRGIVWRLMACSSGMAQAPICLCRRSRIRGYSRLKRRKREVIRRLAQGPGLRWCTLTSRRPSRVSVYRASSRRSGFDRRDGCTPQPNSGVLIHTAGNAEDGRLVHDVRALMRMLIRDAMLIHEGPRFAQHDMPSRSCTTRPAGRGMGLDAQGSRAGSWGR